MKATTEVTSKTINSTTITSKANNKLPAVVETVGDIDNWKKMKRALYGISKGKFAYSF